MRKLDVAPTTVAGRRGPSLLLDRPWIDRLLASDPGLLRLRLAARAVAAMILALGATRLAAEATGQNPLIAMAVGTILAMVTAFAATDTTRVGQAETTGANVVAFAAGLILGVGLGGDRALSLVMLSVTIWVGTYLRRYGPRGMAAGMALWMGDFFGFYLGVKPALIGWLLLWAVMGGVAYLLVATLLVPTSQRQELRQLQGAFAGRSRALARAAMAVLDHGPSRRRLRRLASRQARLNETALLVDGRLADPEALPPGASAYAVHQRLFDVELAWTGLRWAIEQLAPRPLDAATRRRIRQILVELEHGRLAPAVDGALGLVDGWAGPGRTEPTRPAGPGRAPGDPVTAGLLFRLAEAVVELGSAGMAWLEAGDELTGPDAARFASPVVLFGGNLPGSAPLDTPAVPLWRRGPLARVRVRPTTRLAFTVTAAVAAATIAGDALSGRRFYWAVLAALLTFFGTNTNGEQVTKAFYRVAGTAVGIWLGMLAAHLIGHNGWAAVAVILGGLGVGFYAVRVSYFLFMPGLIVAMAAVYEEFGEYTNGLLVLRLEETAIGAVIAVLAALLVFPVRTTDAAARAEAELLDAVSGVVDQVGDRLDGGPGAELRVAARHVDLGVHRLVVTARPLARNRLRPSGDRVESTLAIYRRLAWLAGNLVRASDAVTSDAGVAAAVDEALDRIRAGIGSLRDGGGYHRSAVLLDRLDAALVDWAEDEAQWRLVVRFLGRMDDTLALVARRRGLEVDGDSFETLIGGRGWQFEHQRARRLADRAS